MRLKIIYIALLAFLLSCESAQVDDLSTHLEDVSFSASQEDDTTKGTPINDAMELSDIGVFATLTRRLYAEVEPLTPNFMSNQRVERVGDRWQYTPVRRWSSDPEDLITFFGYAPYATDENGITIKEESGELPTIYYKVPRRDTPNHPDLMVAVPEKDRVGSQGAVNLTFRHALAAVSFSVKGDPSRKVTDVKLSNVVPAATLSLDGSHIEWSNRANVSSRSFDLGLVGGVTPPEDGDSAASITASDGYLMMIPQDITDVEIEVQVDNEDELVYLNFEPGSEWVAGKKYNYVIDLSEDEELSYDITETSNCYIVNNETITDIYIPIDQRINLFWRDYSGLDATESAKYMIGSDTEWRADVEWCDNSGLSDATAERYTGDVPEDCAISKSYVCDGTSAVMRVKLPVNVEIGNILVTVKKDIDDVESVLWSWHIWVTDYNPDVPICIATNSKKYSVTNGKIHRYTIDSDMWSTGLYAESFAMDRDIGSHDNNSTDAMFYQWGRKDPFMAESGRSIEKHCATFAKAVQNPTTFYANGDGWCNEPSVDAYDVTDYLWYDVTKRNPLFHTGVSAFEKSIFDPSPLGWCVPMSAAYEEWETRHDYNGIVYFTVSGYICSTCGNLHSDGDMSALWSSDRVNDGDAYYVYIDDQRFWLLDGSTAYGQHIRPVKIPN